MADYSYNVSTGAITLARSYLWGLDLSGKLHGAGGVGGLLAMFDSATGSYEFPVYDANGNIHGFTDRITGQVTAAYEYGPFGETLRSNGTFAQANPFRFSSKFTDNETDLVYYGHRYYNPSTGRWLSRDPKEELAGLHLYAFLRNNALDKWDFLGWHSTPGGSTDGVGDGYDSGAGIGAGTVYGGEETSLPNSNTVQGLWNNSISSAQQQVTNAIANASNSLNLPDGSTPVSTGYGSTSTMTANNAGTNVIDGANGMTFLGNANAPFNVEGGVVYARVFSANGQGVWVQQVTVATAVTGPNGTKVLASDGTPGTSSTTFYELLPPGNNGTSRDHFITPAWPAGSTGDVTVTGESQFYPGGTPDNFDDIPGPGQPGHVPASGQNPSSMLPPLNWSGTAGAQSGTIIQPIPGGANNVFLIK